MSKKGRKNHTFARFLLLVYGGFMLWLLVGRTSRWVSGETYGQMLLQNINWMPFFTIGNYLKVVLEHTNEAARSHCIINLVGNVVLFVLPGWLLPHIWSRYRNFFRFFFTCLGTILVIEVAQLLTLLGSFDVDDVILNMLGLLLGYLAYILTHLKKKK